MTVAAFEKENELKGTDILSISELVTYALEVKGTDLKKNTIAAKETILDSLAEMLEKMLTLDIDLSKQKKIETIHLLNKLKANKEYMQLVKGSSAGNKKAFDDVYKASERMLKKSQSAFGVD
jgi:hypothetical protein